MNTSKIVDTSYKLWYIIQKVGYAVSILLCIRFFIMRESQTLKEEKMEDNVSYMTQQGLEALQKEVERLKTVERAEVTKLIGEAKSFGDLSENSEYDAAKTKEAEVEMRIKTLEEIIRNAKIISHENIDTSKVNL